MTLLAPAWRASSSLSCARMTTLIGTCGDRWRTVRTIKIEVSSRPADTSTERACAMRMRSEEHTSELQSLMRISYAVFCLKKKTYAQTQHRGQLERRSITRKTV